MNLLIKGLPKFVPPVYGCWGILGSVNVTAVKPAMVRRTGEGVDYGQSSKGLVMKESIYEVLNNI